MLRRTSLRILLGAAGAGLSQGANLPRPAPDLTILLPGGRPPLRLSQLRGKAVALEFLLTHCSHCQKASQTMEKLYREYGPKGFVAVGAAIDPAGNVVDYARKFGLTYPVGMCNSEAAMNFLQHPMMLRFMMPQAAFIDREGVIRSQFPGDSPFFGADEEKNMRAQIEAMLGGAKPAPGKKGGGKNKAG